MRVIVGLGNPGREYQKTRHNVGFDVLKQLALRHGISQVQHRFEAEVADFQLAGEKIVLVAPQTFMNLSGRSVSAVTKFFKLPPEDILVICDDMNLKLGQIRLRRGGSAGGQKGLADIIRSLGTQEIPRLRIGIGRPPGRIDPVDYVLGRFSAADQEVIEVALQKAADGAELWARSGIDATMNQLNARKPEGDDPATS